MNPYGFIGGVCNYYNFDWKTATKKISWIQLLLLGASVPKSKSKKTSEKKKKKDFDQIIQDSMRI